MKKIGSPTFAPGHGWFVDTQTRRSALAHQPISSHTKSGVEGGMHDALSAAEWSRVCFDLYSGAVKAPSYFST